MSKKDKTSGVHAIRALVEEVARGQRMLTAINEWKGAPAPAPALPLRLSQVAQLDELLQLVDRSISAIDSFKRKIQETKGRGQKKKKEGLTKKISNEVEKLREYRDDVNNNLVKNTAYVNRRVTRTGTAGQKDDDATQMERMRIIIDRAKVALNKIDKARGSALSGGFDSDLGSDFSGSDFDSDSDW